MTGRPHEIRTVYHVTTRAAADSILAGGFEDRSCWAFPGRLARGSFFCGFPARDLPGAPATAGGVVLAVDVPEPELALCFIEDHNPEPMWIIPARVINRYQVSELPSAAAAPSGL